MKEIEEKLKELSARIRQKHKNPDSNIIKLANSWRERLGDRKYLETLITLFEEELQ
jgi:hypothetical protein